MKNCFIISLFICVVFLISNCKKTEDQLPPAAAVPSTKTIAGFAQKGPFLNGSTITVYELNSSFSQTGKSFSTQIIDNTGSFQLSDISLATNYVQIRADGFYFNEVCGSNSKSQITLNCISNIGNPGSLHINLLTHLEKPRVEYLLATGITFDSAKNEAQREVLNIFNMNSSDIPNSENLDISENGEGNARLLAISSILQGFRTESELSSLLSTISNDIRTDGILNDVATQSSIIDHALLLDTISIRTNVSAFYSSLGITANIPHFEKYINQFIDNTSFTVTNSVMTYPATGLYGNNVLAKDQLTYGLYVSMAGSLKECSHLTIRVHVISGSTFGNALGSTTNLTISSYDPSNNDQFYTVIDPSLPFDHHLSFNGPPSGGGGSYLIEYFEKDLSVPSFSKTITAY
jgi:hypothetical protein